MSKELELQAATSSLSELKESFDECCRGRDNFSDLHDKAQSSIKDLRNNLNESEESKLIIEESLQDAQCRCDSLERKVTSLQSELSETRSKVRFHECQLDYG